MIGAAEIKKLVDALKEHRHSVDTLNTRIHQLNESIKHNNALLIEHGRIMKELNSDD